MVHYGSLWCIMVQYGASWCIMVYYCAIWYFIVHFGELQCIMVHYGALLCIMAAYGAIWCIMVYYGALWCIVVHCGAFNTADFKNQFSRKIKPNKRKHYSHGPKISNTILCQIRVGRSYLKSHTFSIGHADTNTCSCDNTTPETPLHFFINCPRFTEARRTLFDQVEQSFIPKFKNLPQKRQLEILTEGFEPENHGLKRINIKIIKQTQFYILKTKRFSKP